jgi:hypothetical protein
MNKLLPTDPEFCIITPISYLSHALRSHRHLVLAHLVDESDEYAAFYKQRSVEGDYIIQDNSAYEKLIPYSPERLIELGHKCGADAIVLPDYPFQPAQKTIDAAIEFIPQFKEAGMHSFFVPQSEQGNLEDWIRAYVWAANNPNVDIIGMSILGIPNALPAIDPAFARVVMVQLLQDRKLFNYNTYHHFLGLNSGAGLEIPSLLRMNALTSVDSSGPVLAGILGHEYTTDADSLQTVKKLKIPVDFHMKHIKDNTTDVRIQHNIDLTLGLFIEKRPTAWYAQE